LLITYLQYSAEEQSICALSLSSKVCILSGISF
jgi:hypothetical protein